MDECIVVLTIKQSYQLSHALRFAADSAQHDGAESPIIEISINAVTGEITTVTPSGDFVAETTCTTAEIN